MLRRDNRQAGREERHGGPTGADPTTGGPARYQIRQRMFAIGNDFWIENDRGLRAYKVDGRALRVRNTLILEDSRGQQLARIQQRLARVRDTMAIEDPNGQRIGLVRKALITPLRDRWTVNIRNGPDLAVQGNILNLEYTIGDGRNTVAEVSKRFFRVRDTYGVQISPGQDEVVILMIVIAIDDMAHSSR